LNRFAVNKNILLCILRSKSIISILFEAISFVMRGLIKINFWVYLFAYPAKELASVAGV